MAVYWFLIAYFTVGAAVASSLPNQTETRPNLLYMAGAVILVVVIGMRYQVGGDWSQYLWMFHYAGQMDFSQALSIGDPGYQAVNWLAYQTGGEVWLVNLIAAAFFVWGLFRVCRGQPEPWLAVVIAIPYMVIVIAMGYTRQAVALGILMAGIAAFIRGGSLVRFAIYVVGAALFHKSAVIGFPVVALATQRNRLTNFLLVGAGGIALYDVFLGDAMDHFLRNYVKTHYSSEGAAVRILMNIVATVIFWAARDRLHFSALEQKVWRNFAIASVFSLVALILSPSSAAVDRISLYLIPLQIAVLARVPILFPAPLLGRATIVFYSLAVEFVWLNFAHFAGFWVPYRYYPF